MLSITRVDARAYSRATEVLERVKTAVLNLYPENIRDKIDITATKTISHSKTPIIIISATTKAKDAAKATFSYLLSSLSEEDKNELKRTLKKRVNEKCVLFIRIDKQAAFLGDIQLASEPDLVRVKVYIQMYPRCDQDAVITSIMDQIHADGR